jgi:hypothetical protein
MILVILMSQLGTFAFAAYWLVSPPGDLQNAFMPSTVSLALLAVFLALLAVFRLGQSFGSGAASQDRVA